MTESKYVPAKLRNLVAKRANFICEYYRSPEDFSAESFAVKHIFLPNIGLTPTGRATIEALKLNRKGVINLRWALFAVGKHPPK